MTWGMVAVAGATVAGGLIASDSARSASNKISDANKASNATQQAQYDQTRQDNMPALDARNASLQKMRELLGIGGDTGAQGYGSLGGGINPGDVTQDPGYQFGLQQGQQGLNNQLTARGMRNSGAALKAASRYASDYGTTKYNDAFNRVVANRSAQLNPLQSLANTAQTGASTIANSGQNYANQVGNNQSSLGNALGASSIATGNTWGNALQQGAGWYSNMNKNSQINGFNGNAWTGYTNVDPSLVGPQYQP